MGILLAVGVTILLAIVISIAYLLILSELRKINANLEQFIKLIIDARRRMIPKRANKIARRLSAAVSLNPALTTNPPESGLRKLTSVKKLRRFGRAPAGAFSYRWQGPPSDNLACATGRRPEQLASRRNRQSTARRRSRLLQGRGRPDAVCRQWFAAIRGASSRAVRCGSALN